MNHKLDNDTVTVVDYWDQNGWKIVEGSRILLEWGMNRAQLDAQRRYNVKKNKSVPKFFSSKKLTDPISRNEKSLEPKQARKVFQCDLCGHYKKLAPGSVVSRTFPTTSKIKLSNLSEYRLPKSDLAKFRTKTKGNTDCWVYAQKRTLPYKNLMEENSIIKKRNSREFRGLIKFPYREADNTPGKYPTNSSNCRLRNIQNSCQFESFAMLFPTPLKKRPI